MDIFLTILLASALAADDDERDEPAAAPAASAPRVMYDFGDLDVSGELVMPQGAYAATPGGAQDIAYFRDQVSRGQVPLPEVFTPEGLLSEHDLPLAPSRPCERLLCTDARAASASFAVQPDVDWLVQVGFGSGLTDETFHPAPLNLVAVVDKSCSMSDDPIETVRASLREVAERMGPDDQLSIVLYGADVATHLPPTRGGDPAIRRAIDSIAIDGSTNLEAGLTRGFALARESRRHFDGTTRVMLFTDERPNTGRTDAASFMGLAEAASRDHIGMTTVGVGVQFGAELAQQVSAVRGGNLVFFPDTGTMRQRFARDFDLWVTELAYDLDVEVHPAAGLRIAGVYGVPGDLVRWTDGGSIALHVSTLFLSRDAGAIYVSLAREDGGPARPVRIGDNVASIDLSYEPRDGSRSLSTSPVPLVVPGDGDAGLVRGALLVDEATTLKQATALHHHDNDQDGAWRLVHALRQRLDAVPDPELRRVELVAGLEDTLGKLAGRAGRCRWSATPSPAPAAVTAVGGGIHWRRHRGDP
ncbi:MAG: VWA domain-containing protein [Myxococcota bacterium]